VKLILIRHGRPDWQFPRFSTLLQFERGVEGYDEAGLSESGSKAIADAVAQLPTAKILSSDLLRARMTAEILAEFSQQPIEFDPIFREVKTTKISSGHLGKLWGPNFIWTLLRFLAWLTGIGDYVESPRQLWQRLAKVHQILRSHFETEDTIILVSHGWFITLLALYLRLQRTIESGPILPGTDYGSSTEYILNDQKQR
jgi:broad specificity phosphatase PhoE